MSESSSSQPHKLLPQLMKFGLVGGFGVVVNVLVFNILRATIFSDTSEQVLFATLIATLCAIFTNWIGNRHWAFAHAKQKNATREGFEFFLVSLIGTLIPLASVGFARYGLGTTSILADNIANLGIGLPLGTIFRFIFYRYWVFSAQREDRRLKKQAETSSDESQDIQLEPIS